MKDFRWQVGQVLNFNQLFIFKILIPFLYSHLCSQCAWVWKTFTSDELVVIPDLQCQFPVFKPSSQVFLLGMCSAYLSGNTNMLNSVQLSVFLPGSQQHRLYSLSLNHLPHLLFFCTTEEPSSIWVVFQSSTSLGLRNVFIATMELGLQDDTWHILFQQKFVFPLLWSRRHPPFYLLNKAMHISVWEICPVAQLEINKCSNKMGGTIPKCRIIQVGAPWLLRGVGLWGAGYDGPSLVF